MKKRVLPIVVGMGGVALAGCGEPASKDKPSATAEKTESRAGSSSSALPTKQLPTVITRDQTPPIPMAGAIAPARPQPTAPAPSPSGSPSTSMAPAPGAPSPAAPAAAAAAATPEPAGVDSVAIVHNHAAGEPCTPISNEELQKAFGDLKKP